MNEPDIALEDRARALLTLAAETIDSAPVIPARPSRPRGRAWLAAVAAALVVAGLAAWLVPPDAADDPSPAPPAGGVVPQVRWMTEDKATEALVAAGYGAQTADRATCDAPEGRALRTRPAAGTPADPGAVIRVVVARTPPAATCVRTSSLALDLLDLARTGSTDLRFAPDVTVYVEGEPTRSLTTEEALDPAAWGDPSPLTALVENVRGLDLRPMHDDGDQFACGDGDPPPALRSRPSQVLDLTAPSPPRSIGVCQWLRVYRDEAGRIDAVTSSTRP